MKKSDTAFRSQFIFLIFFVFCLITPIMAQRTVTADFTADPVEGYAPLHVQFTDQSTGPVVTWQWSFPNGSPPNASGQGPHTILYPTPGQYDVTLYIADADTSDHEVTKSNIITVWAPDRDFGDAPDDQPPWNYPTLRSSDGACHTVSASIYLGEEVDAENDGQPDRNATGDDLNGTDDEDGVSIPSVSMGQPFTVNVKVHGSGWLHAWMDWNADGDWEDSEEKVLDTVPLSTGSHDLTINAPDSQAEGTTFARFRYNSTDRMLGPDDWGDDGEVEDYEIIILDLEPDIEFDFGDAPDPAYPTLLASNGARHIISSDIYLGALVDADTDGLPAADAQGDDTDGDDDEDGVVIPYFLPGEIAVIRLTIHGSGYLNAWFDFNDNGVWDVQGEKYTSDLLSGSNINIPISVPEQAVPGVTFARFRYCSAILDAPTGLAGDGEVEDYQMIIADDFLKDSLALVALYNSTDGPNWTESTNWLTGPVSSWFGITTHEGRVTEVDLGLNNMDGFLPPELKYLTAVKDFNLGSNYLFGPIPPEICLMTELRILDFMGNELTSIPSQIGNLTHLRGLYLGANEISFIPPEIGECVLLEVIGLGANHDIEHIPPEIGNLIHLRGLTVGCGLLSLPPEIGNCVQLKSLGLGSNKIHVIPSSIGNLVNLTYLDLYGNGIHELPDEICNLESIEIFNLGLNYLSTLPDEFGQLHKLKSLFLHFNELVSLPEDFWNLTELQRLTLQINQISYISPQISNLTRLDYLNMNANNLTELPDLSCLTLLDELKIHWNKFTFEDIEPLMSNTFSVLDYSPQDSVGSKMDIDIASGEKLTLSVTVGGSANHYHWKKDGTEIPGALDSDTYIISAVTVFDAGTYECAVTNDIVTDLTINCRPMHVTVDGETPVPEESRPLPETFALKQNHPNPFNPETHIEYHLPRQAQVRITVYDIAGRKIRTLLNERQDAGVQTVMWNGRDDQGKKVTSGIYICRLTAADYSETMKMILVQ